MVVLGGGAVSYERGTPVLTCVESSAAENVKERATRAAYTPQKSRRGGRLRAHPKPPRVLDTPTSVLDTPTGVFDTPLSVFDTPTGALDTPTSVLGTPIGVSNTPTCVLDTP